MYAVRLGHDPDAIPLARELGAASAARGEWSCGVTGGGEAPGLMLGLSGIGALFLGLPEPHCFHLAGLPAPFADG